MQSLHDKYTKCLSAGKFFRESLKILIYSSNCVSFQTNVGNFGCL